MVNYSRAQYQAFAQQLVDNRRRDEPWFRAAYRFGLSHPELAADPVMIGQELYPRFGEAVYDQVMDGLILADEENRNPDTSNHVAASAKRGGRIHAFGNGGSQLMDDEDYTEINRQRAINARVHERVQEIEERVKAREKEIEELVLAKTMHLLKRREAWQKKISETEGKHHHLREAYMKSQRDNERLAGMKDRSRRELKMQVEDLEHGLPGQPIKVEMDRKGMFVDDDKTRLHKKQGGRIRHKRFI